MPYTGDPANNPLDEFRLNVGDTNPDAPIFTDGEINYYIAKYGDVTTASVNALYSLKARASHVVNESVGGTSKQYSNLIKQYDEMIKALKGKASLDAMLNASAPIYAGGISIADKKLKESNIDRVDPFFTRDSTDSIDSDLYQG